MIMCMDKFQNEWRPHEDLLRDTHILTPYQLNELILDKNSKPRANPCNSYTMGCPPVRGDNPRALASGLSNVQVDTHGITILYHLH